jgi:hypothetical protein
VLVPNTYSSNTTQRPLEVKLARNKEERKTDIIIVDDFLISHIQETSHHHEVAVSVDLAGRIGALDCRFLCSQTL